MAIQQSGVVTPGHAAIWSTAGVLQDGGALPAAARVIGSFRGANFNTTNDQPISIPTRIVAFAITGIVITNATISLTTAAGGFYPLAAKAGTPIVSSGQVYSALTTAAGLLNATLASFGANTRFSASNLGAIGGILQVWLSLTTPQGAAAQADVYLLGQDLT